jgi:hypothetical protein
VCVRTRWWCGWRQRGWKLRRQCWRQLRQQHGQRRYGRFIGCDRQFTFRVFVVNGCWQQRRRQRWFDGLGKYRIIDGFFRLRCERLGLEWIIHWF